MDTFGDKVWLEVIKAILAMFLLFVTWAAGQNIIAYWDLKKKRQENDLATANQFYQLYGEFRTLWRLWKAYKNHGQGDTPAISPPIETRWNLLERATVAEGKVEAVILKLAAERTLSNKQIEDLGLFRQAYQTLRQSIRDDVLPNFGPNDGIYVVFGELAGRVGCMIDFAKKPDWLVTLAEDPEERPNDEVATANLQMILTKFRSGELKNAVDKKEVALRKNR